jgi:hypothetical protein
MVRIKEGGSTLRQKNYALKSFAGDGRSKKAIALDCGYPPNVANSVVSKIESKQGYKNAMVEILQESDNAVLGIFAALRDRGYEDFSNKDLISAVTAIGNAWSKFRGVVEPGETPTGHNQLKTVILQQIENQTINTQKKEEEKIIEAVVDNPNDF